MNTPTNSATPFELNMLITYNPWSISIDATLEEVVRMLCQLGFHHWPVVDDEKNLVGILTEEDVVRTIDQQQVESPTSSNIDPALGWNHCRVEQFMSREMIALDHRESPCKALELLLDHNIHSFPVVENDRLIGVITSTDFLREFSYSDIAATRSTVSELMTKQEEPLEFNATLEEALEAINSSAVDYLSIVRGGCPLGAISRRSLQKAMFSKMASQFLGEEMNEFGATSVSEIIIESPLARPGQRIALAASEMVEHHVQALAVANQANRLLGIISENDILSALRQETSFLC